MDDQEYRSYSGAAIAGTLAFFLLPGAILTGVPDEIGQIVGGLLPDFAFSADTVGLPALRYDLPEQVTNVMEEKLNLINPNTMDEKEYSGYAGAAVAGTLLFFLIPGAIITGELEAIGELGALFVKDFLFSAIIGGGLAIYLSLRNDEIGDTVNSAGSKLLDTIDGLFEGSS